MPGDPDDYEDTSGTIIWEVGDSQLVKTFYITICDDGSQEPDQTINLHLTGLSQNAMWGEHQDAVLTINDND